MSHKLKTFISELKNRYSFYKTNSDVNAKYSIQFVCGFHGLSGGSEAIVSVANQLSKSFKVSFFTFPKSPLNPILGSFVRKATEIEEADLFIVDRSLSEEEYKTIKSFNVPIIVSIHGKPNSLHGLKDDVSMQVFNYATDCHFVSLTQSELFQDEARNSFVIANSSDDLRSCSYIETRTRTKRLGLVGNFEAPRKNLNKNIESGLQSDADTIIVWGNTLEKISDKRVIYKGYGHDKVEIYSSFDVFISLSTDENLPLAIIQALGAGKPCVLSDIPAHREFAHCKGVVLVELDDKQQIVNAVNQLLKEYSSLKETCENFWFDNFSEQQISENWKRTVIRLIENSKCA